MFITVYTYSLLFYNITKQTGVFKNLQLIQLINIRRDGQYNMIL